MENKFECSLCYRIFNTKQLLNNHENLKNKCNTVTEFQCKKCLKYLKSRRNLNQHVCKLYNKEKVEEYYKEEEFGASTFTGNISFLLKYLRSKMKILE